MWAILHSRPWKIPSVWTVTIYRWDHFSFRKIPSSRGSFAIWLLPLSSNTTRCTCVDATEWIFLQMSSVGSMLTICSWGLILICSPSNKNPHLLHLFSLTCHIPFNPFLSSWLIISQVFSVFKESSSSVFRFFSLIFTRLILMLGMFFVTFLGIGHVRCGFYASITCGSCTALNFITPPFKSHTFITLPLR